MDAQTKVPLVEMKDISIAFGGVKAVDRASVNLYPGEVVGLLGHNGAGKSTLIKVLSGAYKRDSGQIFVNGEEAQIANPRDAKRYGIETIYQTLALADNVDAAMRKAIATLPRELCKTITWDQGAEMANHARFTIATGIPIYFCDPHAPWQRGTNENTNGLLRQYLPKGMDLSTVSAAELRAVQRSLNNRPRKTLGYLSPLEKYTELVASTG